jgi:DNA-binding MarR family transcriptional regulator
MSAVGAHVQIRFAELLEPLGLLPAHFGVLRCISVHEGATQQEIADALRRRRAAMVGLVDELEAKGLVQRRRHPVDRRANALHITAAGQRLVAKVSVNSAVLEDELLAPLPAPAREAFLQGLLLVGAAAGVGDGIFPSVDSTDPDEQEHHREDAPAAAPRSRSTETVTARSHADRPGRVPRPTRTDRKA